VIAWVTTYLVWIMVAGFVAVWLFAEDRRGKLYLGCSAFAGLVIVLILAKIAGSLYYDPRPFVEDPSLVPLIPHAPDNGFPSDHSSAAGLIATAIALRHRWYGALLGIAAVVIAWSRVAAHVHHVQDVIAGLALGAIAALLGTLLVRWLFDRFRVLGRGPVARLVGPESGGGGGRVARSPRRADDGPGDRGRGL
jgi:undecaprenyl-diphosphatase